MNLKQRLDTIAKLEQIDTPFNIMRVFGHISLFGSQVFFGKDNDYVDEKELKQAIEELAAQLGGKVKWPKEAK
jgi:hypothetical protein